MTTTNATDRKRLNKQSIQDAYVKGGGVTAVRSLLEKFPGAKQTFRKVIQDLSDLGRDVSDLKTLDSEMFGSKKTFVTAFDATVLGTPEQIAADNGIDQNKVYIIARAREIEPECFLREDGARGKGTALYNREEMKAEIAAFAAEKKAAFRESFDAATEVTTAGVATLVQEKLGLDGVHAGSLLKLFGVPCLGKFREGAKGKGSNLYDLATVQKVIDLVLSNRGAGGGEDDDSGEPQKATEVVEATEQGTDEVNTSLLTLPETAEVNEPEVIEIDPAMMEAAQFGSLG